MRYFPPWLLLLGALTALGPLSIDMYLPSFPAISHSLGASPGSVQLTLASFFIGLAIGQAIYGPFSDRFGRKPPLYFGLVIYILASIGCVFATHIDQLIALRFLQALGGCAGMVVSRAVVRDRCNVQEMAKAFSTLMLIMGLAPILAPIVGGWVVTTLGWRAIFAFQMLFGLACLINVHFFFKETHNTQHSPALELGKVLKGYATLIRDKAFMRHTLTGSLIMGGFFGYIAGSPYIIIELFGVPAEHFGWIFGSNAAGFIISSQFNARALKNHSTANLLRHALYLPALSGLSLFALQIFGLLNFPLLLLGLFVFITSMGFITPNTSAMALQYQSKQAGLASALLGTLQFGCATLAGLLMGLWHDNSALPLLTLLAACGTGAWLLNRTEPAAVVKA
jgi:DHA1 family bicyclomycin/chloramphenicol resistance-like MFS transporter